jgi:hypothetical protein
MSRADADKFQTLVVIANQVAAQFNGALDTCVLTSFALNNVLQRLRYDSRPLRIEAAVFPDDRKLYGNILGRIEPGSRRAASPGKWWGHLAVAVENEWLLDPTLDQANKKEWPQAIHVGPLAVQAHGRLLGGTWVDPDSDEWLHGTVFSASAASWICPCWRRAAIPLETAR